MVYDCFIFFNELDLLEVRLNELDNVVDYFVLVESKKTFTNNDKPLYYLDNKDKFGKFHKKIIHIILEDLPSDSDAWGNEYYQRNSIMKGLVNCNDNDMIMVSDADEIPNPYEIEKIKADFDTNKVYNFISKLYYYFINVFYFDYWSGTKLCSYSFLKKITPQELRMIEYPSTTFLRNSGWHFSYLGGIDKIKHKIESFAHSEINNDFIKDKIQDNVENLKCLVNKDKNLTVVDIDDTYPKYILNNIEKFNHLIKQKT